jgi:hypothetical protein
MNKQCCLKCLRRGFRCGGCDQEDTDSDICDVCDEPCSKYREHFLDDEE